MKAISLRAAPPGATIPSSLFLLLLAAACGDGDGNSALPVAPVPPAVVIAYTNGVTTTANPAAYWNKIGVDTITLAANPAGTPEEQRTVLQVDLATLHVAIYDAVMAIAGTHLPFVVTPTTATAGASQEAAAAAAAYSVLKGLYPSRSVQYQNAYDTYVAELPTGDAKARGLAIGSEVAAKILSLRANDGRLSAVIYSPGTEPGTFRGVNPIGTFIRYIRPFSLLSATQYLPPPPPALGSAEYAADYEQVRGLGGTVSTARTAEQLEAARAHTENPATYTTRNYRAIAQDGRTLAENARLLAMFWVAQADTNIACFEAKYRYGYWRPQSAIPLADTDGNPATAPDPTWTPVLPTPNHPEYPSAHMCQNSAAAEVLRSYFGTRNISFSFSSTVTGNVRAYANPDELLVEIELARVTGGMHFRNSNIEGAVLGTRVGAWVAANHFKAR